MHALFTEDVSYRGLFMCTEIPPPVRQLIRIETILPPNNVPFATHGMVVYVIGKDDASGRQPGIGVQFYGMGDERRVWESFIQFIQASSEKVPDRRNGVAKTGAGAVPQALPPVASGPVAVQPAAAPEAPAAEDAQDILDEETVTAVEEAPVAVAEETPAAEEAPVTAAEAPVTAAEAPEPHAPPPVQPCKSGNGDPLSVRVTFGRGVHENRRYHRFPIVLEVWPRNMEELVCMYSRDVSVGGMFLPTAREIPVASELRLEIRHPQTDAMFPMTAVVRRRSTQPLGIGVEFIGLDERRRRQFFEFINAPLPVRESGEHALREGD